MDKKPNNNKYLNQRSNSNLNNAQLYDIKNHNQNPPRKAEYVKPNYQIIEQFVLDRLDKGMDLIDILILARERFNDTVLDSYLYEMRAKGII